MCLNGNPKIACSANDDCSFCEQSSFVFIEHTHTHTQRPQHKRKPYSKLKLAEYRRATVFGVHSTKRNSFKCKINTSNDWVLTWSTVLHLHLYFVRKHKNNFQFRNKCCILLIICFLERLNLPTNANYIFLDPTNTAEPIEIWSAG